MFCTPICTSIFNGCQQLAERDLAIALKQTTVFWILHRKRVCFPSHCRNINSMSICWNYKL